VSALNGQGGLDRRRGYGVDFPEFLSLSVTALHSCMAAARLMETLRKVMPLDRCHRVSHVLLRMLAVLLAC
jgi:hypothetical protein